MMAHPTPMTRCNDVSCRLYAAAAASIDEATELPTCCAEYGKAVRAGLEIGAREVSEDLSCELGTSDTHRPHSIPPCAMVERVR
jgi:hypothetical protein